MDYKILEEFNRMCKFYGNHTKTEHGTTLRCGDCPAQKHFYTHCLLVNLSVLGYVFRPAKAAEIIEKWAAEHPVKTYADVFFEKFPDAPRKADGRTPMCDPCDIWEEMGDIGNTCSGCCPMAKCWQQPYPERRDEK